MPVQSLTRAFDILNIISESPEGIGVTTISAELGLAQKHCFPLASYA